MPNREGQPFDKQNFVLLVKELKQSFRPHNLLLTSAIGASPNVIDQAYDIPNLNKYLDFLHIMCYDYGGAWDRRVTANAPLHSEGMLSVQYTLDHLIKLGASPSKLVMGLPFYGRTFITQLEGNFEDATMETGFTGIYTRENGFMGYNEICDVLTNKSSGWIRSWDSNTTQGVARFKDPMKQETRVAVYDSPRSIANKVRYAVRNKLAGAMVWSIDTDDFHGDCATDDDTFEDVIAEAGPGIILTIPKRVNTNYPLLRTINEGIIVAQEELDAQSSADDKDKENEIPHGDDHQHHHDGKGSAAAATLSICIVIFAGFAHIRPQNV